MKKTLIWIALLLPAFAVAQDKNNGEELIQTFFDYYEHKGHNEAFHYALSTNKWLKPNGDELAPFSARLTKTVAGMGKYIGYEEIRNKNIGSRFRVISILVYYQRDPVLFTFELYKNDMGWEIANVSFDAKFEREIDEASRVSLNN